MRNGKNGNGNSESMPCSEDAEKGLLSSLLLGGDRVAVEVTVRKQAFYIPAHRIIWDALNDLVAEKRPLDYVIVKNRLAALGQLDEVGGKEYLSDLYGFVPTCANYKYYAEIVRDKHRIRQAMLGAMAMTNRLRERGTSDWNELRCDIEREYAAMMDDSDDDEVTTKEITAQWFDELSVRRERLAREGVGFGLPGVDGTLGMQQPGEVVTIGAPTSTGKTMLAYQGMAHNLRKGLPVGLVSLEMTVMQTWDRLASHMFKVSMNRFRDGCFDGEDGKKLTAFYKEMVAKLPFYFYQNRRQRDIDAIKNWARRIKARYGLRLLVVDYLQRVKVTVLQRQSRQEEVAYASNELKDLALELGITIWCPVQLNKKDEVRESQAIEHDADIAIRISVDKDSRASGNIVFDKVRQGKLKDSLPIWIKGGYQTIEEQEEYDAERIA